MHMQNQSKENLKKKAINYLKPDKKRKGYICPICASGTGANGTGMTTKDNIHFTCWKGCFKNADIIDIIGIKYNISSYKDKLKKTAKLLNENLGTNKAKESITFEEYFIKTKKEINKTLYHRGISLKTLTKFNIGYDPLWKHPKIPNTKPSPRLIIPINNSSYLARDTRENINNIEEKYSKIRVGKSQIFNLNALYTSRKPIFIVEGEIDALSIIDMGSEAIALGSVSNINLLLSSLEGKKISQTLIISMDNDIAGKRAQNKLAESLSLLDIDFIELDVACGYKDANEALNQNKKLFKQNILSLENLAKKVSNDKKNKLNDQSALNTLYILLKGIKKEDNITKIYPTRFKTLDNILYGGLYTGLYIVGSIPSLGKTTFCLQIADNIAKQDIDVLIFSLEMSKYELISKSLSRHTAILSYMDLKDMKLAKTMRQIITGEVYKNCYNFDNNIIERAIDEYSKYAQKIYIYENIDNLNVRKIGEILDNFININNRRPVVIIDYLQILSPFDKYLSDKQNIDKSVLELKKISRNYNIPIIGISSFNRDSYSSPVNLSSFKESGAIEYATDVLIGLQYEGMDYKNNESDKVREKRVYDIMKQNNLYAEKGKSQIIQVKVLKNRNGEKGEFNIKFYPKFNYFCDTKEVENSEWLRSHSKWE